MISSLPEEEEGSFSWRTSLGNRRGMLFTTLSQDCLPSRHVVHYILRAGEFQSQVAQRTERKSRSLEQIYDADASLQLLMLGWRVPHKGRAFLPDLKRWVFLNVLLIPNQRILLCRVPDIFNLFHQQLITHFELQWRTKYMPKCPKVHQ